MSEVVTIGLSSMAVVKKPDRLRTLGLGSCVGVILYDSKLGQAGMAHVMLPDHALSGREDPPAKFADTAIPALIDDLLKAGVATGSLKAKLAGGSEMFRSPNGRGISIGERNIQAVKEQLQRFKIPIISEDTGGNYGRTIEFFTETTALHIKTFNKGEQWI